ncbi:hypothetical protein [Actinomadura spongiicola]|uniref:hypothetical protein n=1 Tax=Actinomadura spongiicola TaxID=2303421 RepID=UPI001F250D43|nr:hypothetical protein [Actinomadura spongiicola]
MGEKLTLPVPETLYGTYAVALPEPITDPAQLARDEVARRTAPPLRDRVLAMLDSPMLTLDQRPTADFPPLPRDLLAAYGTATSDLAAIDTAAHLLAVRAAYRPGHPPAHEWSARAVAGAVAAALATPVIDVFTPQVLVLSHLERSLPGPDGTVRLTDWMLLPHRSGPRGFFFSTRGLARYGLPELQTEDVPPALVVEWGRLLNGLALRVLELWLDELRVDQPSVIDLPEIVSVGLRDIAAAEGADDPSPREVAVRLRLDRSPDLALVVLPAEDDLESLCATLFGPSQSHR